MTWLLKLFTGLKGYSVAIGAALLSFVYLYGRKAGRDALKAKQAEKTLKDVKVANEINENVRSLGDSDLNDKLRRYKRKH